MGEGVSPPGLWHWAQFVCSQARARLSRVWVASVGATRTGTLPGGPGNAALNTPIAARLASRFAVRMAHEKPGFDQLAGQA